VNGNFLAAMEKLGCEAATGAQGRLKLVMPDGIEVRQIYQVAAEQNVQLRRLNHKRDSLEDIFLKAMDAAEVWQAPRPAQPAAVEATNGRL
jgi:ABC-2 type transport system ATP-binding protein